MRTVCFELHDEFEKNSSFICVETVISIVIMLINVTVFCIRLSTLICERFILVSEQMD